MVTWYEWSAYSFEGDALLKVKSTEYYYKSFYFQLTFWGLHFLEGLKFNLSMSQYLESWESDADNK